MKSTLSLLALTLIGGITLASSLGCGEKGNVSTDVTAEEQAQIEAIDEAQDDYYSQNPDG